MRYTIILILLLLAVNAWAAPSTPTVLGTVSHGSSITLSGTGFGTKTAAAPLLWDSVDGTYTGITNGGVVPVGSGHPWANTAFDVDVHFKTSNPRGKWTAKYTNTGSSNANAKAAVGGNNYPGSSLLYVSWWMYVGVRTACTADFSNKWTRFTDDGGWSANVQTVEWTAPSITIYGVGGPDYTNWTETCGIIGEWQRMEKIVDNSGDPHPRVYLHLNNTPVATTQPIQAPTSLLANITGIGVIGFDGSNTPASGQPTIDWGEIYVDNTRARIEICNNSVKSSATHCEIQIPSAWSTTSITATVNQGSFADNSTAYLFVIDSTGAASATGQLVTFGSGAAASHAISRGVKVTGGVVR